MNRRRFLSSTVGGAGLAAAAAATAPAAPTKMKITRGSYYLAGGGAAHLPKSFDLRDGKLWPNEPPGLGVEFDAQAFPKVSEITERTQPIPIYRRPDGSFTNW